MNETQLLAGRHVLLTGATGFVGSHFQQVLSSAGAGMTVIGRTAPLNRDVNWLRADLAVPGSLRDLDLPGDIDTVACLGFAPYRKATAYALPDLQTNVGSLLELMEKVAALKSKPAFLYCSSANVSGGVEQSDTDDLVDSQPLTYWSTQKLLCEQYFQLLNRQCGLGVTVLRIPNVYGEIPELPVSMASPVNTMARRLVETGELTLYRNQNARRSFVHIDDLTKAMATFVAKPCGGFAKRYLNAATASYAEIAEMLLTNHEAAKVWTDLRTLDEFESRSTASLPLGLPRKSNTTPPRSLASGLTALCVRLTRGL